MIERSRVRIPAGTAGEFSSPGSTFCADILFRYPFHPRVTTVARKKSRSFCQKCRWQVTAKHAYTIRIEPCFGIGHNLSLICQMTSEDIKHQLNNNKSRRNSFKKLFLPGVDASHGYVRALALGCFYSHISIRTFRRALTASLDSCAEIKSAPSVM